MLKRFPSQPLIKSNFLLIILSLNFEDCPDIAIYYSSTMHWVDIQFTEASVHFPLQAYSNTQEASDICKSLSV